jgi:lipopolysaccharide assembly outer membrane protein LptD (OstA)
MTVGRALRLGFATGLVVATVARAVEPAATAASPAEVRVLSLPGQPTVLTIQTAPDAVVDDRTPGARAPADPRGAASVGETFTDEVTFVLRGPVAARPATVDVGDALVSTVRLFPDRAGTQVAIFVRQPVTYSIARPTASGAVAVTLRPRTVAAAPERPGERRPGRPKPEGGDEQVAVDAAELSYDQQADVLIARGGVTLTRGATTLRADEVRYDRTRSVAEAHGHVVVVDPEASIEGEAASIDLDDETGWIDGVQADMRQSPYRLTAEHVEKKGGPCYAIRNGEFTTCRCGGVERPSWTIAANETDVTVGGVGVARDATFRVNDVPVLWAPYLLFPANTERQSGLLMPRVAYSNRRGFVYDQPIFWAIDKSSDLTITPDIETAARLGVIGEYRYVWSKRSAGVLTAGFFNEHLGGNPEPIISATADPTTTPQNRWIVAARHRTRIAPDTNLYLDVLRVSDDNFLREIRAFAANVSTDIQVRTTRLTRSRLGTLHTWDTGAVQLELNSDQDLIDPQQFALNRLPRLTAEHSIPLLGGLAVARLPGETMVFERDTGYDGLRVDLAPELYVPFHAGRYLSGSVRGQLRETAYHLMDERQVALVVPDETGGGAKAPTFRTNPVLPDLDRNHSREIAQVHGRVGTEVARVYAFPYLGLDRIRHSIEPEVQYLFIPQVSRQFFQRDLPDCAAVPGGVPGRSCNATLFSEAYLFDDVDPINRRNFVSYGVTTRILGRFGSPAAAFEPEPLPAEPAQALAPGVDEDDEGVDLEDVETIDPDTIPQGLPAETVPPFSRPRAGRPAAPAVTSSRELARASLLQGYDISRRLTGSSHFSDIDAQLRLTPVDWLGLTYNTSVDVSQGRTLARSIGFILREPWWRPPSRTSYQSPTTLGVAYQFVAADLNEDLAEGSAERRFFANDAVENLTAALYLRVGDYVGLGLRARYSLTTTQGLDNGKVREFGPGFQEQDYFVRLTSPCNCWAVELGVSDRLDTGDTTVRAQVALYGLGSFGQGPSASYAALPGLQGLGVRRPTALGREY